MCLSIEKVWEVVGDRKLGLWVEQERGPGWRVTLISKTRRKADMESYNPDMIFHFGSDFLDIPTTLFTTFASVSPPTCIYRQHFSALLPLFHHQPAYTDSTFHHFSHYFTTNLHIPTALFTTFASVSPPTCIYRQHFSPLLPLFHHQPAYTDNTFHHLYVCFTTNLHIPIALFITSASFATLMHLPDAVLNVPPSRRCTH